MENSTLKSFKRFFELKGSITPIAEKAKKTFEQKFEQKNINKAKQQQRLHYFAIGHAFKNIDTKNIFEVELNVETEETKPTKYLALQETNFNFLDKLKNLLSDIRNINSHYVHTFDKLRLNQVDDKVIDFLQESFELALLQTYLNEKEITYEEAVKNGYPKKEIVNFLLEKFYPLNDTRKNLTTEEQKSLNEYIEFRNDFKNKTVKEAIKSILFVKVNSEYQWKLYDEYHIFNITPGEYLSFEACLFLLTMFLYKGEANQLISKIKGFKRNDDNKFRSKRNLFSFFSKRFSSQDINSEEYNLIKFRDIVQYLNHYPTNWNKDLELESDNPTMTHLLKKKIIELEIKRCFPSLISDIKFNEFAKFYLFENKEIETTNKKLYLDIINKNDEIRKIYFAIKEDKLKIAEYKDDTFEMFALRYVLNNYFKDKFHLSAYRYKTFNEKKIIEYNDKLKTNPTTEKLKARIAKSLLYVSYGRNKDRFMDFAIRFLAETNYFGADAKFKMYQFDTTSEQNIEVAKLKQQLPKKDYDNLKYHRGRLTYFSTYDNHLKSNEDRDTPFVIENNAAHVEITFSSGKKKVITIQRKLMIYFLEDALYNNNKIENAGKHLLFGYYANHQKEFNDFKQTLEDNNFDPKEKGKFKKIIPRRLLHHYAPAQQNNLPKYTSLELIYNKALEAEMRYKNLLEKVEKEERVYKQAYPNDKDVSLVQDFLKRNKGKQFKLHFIRKAWHLMYFKDIYLKQVNAHGHHKAFHITKDEINDFSKWMFAFDETPAYKDYLTRLFTKKTFLANNEFKKIFEFSNSLNDMYIKTKIAYKQWLETVEITEKNTDKYKLNNYNELLNNNYLFINVYHFSNFLEKTKRLNKNTENNIIYKSLENEQYLIPEYYYKAKLEKTEYKSCGKLYNKLKSVKLEDALLYELAMRYLKIDKSISTDITKILNQDVVFNIEKPNQTETYELKIPFNKINSYLELISHKRENNEKDKGASFLKNIPGYIKLIKYDEKQKKTKNKEIEKFNANSLCFDDLYKINTHIITNSLKFTKIALSLEEYFICKDIKYHIIPLKDKETRINLCDINSLTDYFDKETRNKAFHFNIPVKSYSSILTEIETKFIKNEVRPISPINYQELPKQVKTVCNVFLDTMHNDYFDFNIKDKKQKRTNAENKYFNKMIKVLEYAY